MQLLISILFGVVFSIYQNTELLAMTGKMDEFSVEDTFSNTIRASTYCKTNNESLFSSKELFFSLNGEII